MLILVALLAACSDGGGGDNEKACAAAEDYVEALQGIDQSDFDSLESGLDAADRANATMIENAPDDVADALEKMDDLDPDSIRISEQDEYEEAQATANEWVREECDLDVGF